MIKSKKSNPFQRPLGTAVMVLMMASALIVSPSLAPVVLFKLCLVTSAAVLGYFIDKLILPQVDFEDLAQVMIDGTDEEQERATKLAQTAMLRRAIIIAGTILGVSLGL